MGPDFSNYTKIFLEEAEEKLGEVEENIVLLENEPDNENPVGDFSTSNGIRYITINLSNLDEVINECSKSNINIINSGTSIRPGVVIGLIEDPDGNLIELMQAD